eukprot:TRINITY_DN44430_c0_g1_i1.p1 TRINITY_DN44430_c0_g1~~TRINITY_DN44430_c0_g1_i1.p1  ORF type:complete len:136 (-),score=32.46 TRINITY_DN44430_c0_g1_i1:75-482(-)
MNTPPRHGEMLPIPHEASDSVLHSGDYQEQIAYGCRMVQEASAQKVHDLEMELEQLRREMESMRRKGDNLREHNAKLEAELKESKKRNQDQMEENRNVAQQVFTLRAQVGKLGQFRSCLDQACTILDDTPVAHRK